MIDLYDPVTAIAAGCCVMFCFSVTATIGMAGLMATGRDRIEVNIDIARAMKRTFWIMFVSGAVALLFTAIALIIHFGSERTMQQQTGELQAKPVDCGCRDARVEFELKPDGTAIALTGCPHREPKPVLVKQTTTLRIAVGDHVFLIQSVCPTAIMKEWETKNANT